MMVVESARDADLPKVVKLAAGSLPTGVDPESLATDAVHGCCMVARDVGSDEIVGFAVARREAPCEGHVLALAVDGAHRGAGIGSALLSRIRAEMRRDGALHLRLDVRADNPRAQAFYARHGFHPEGLHSHAYADGEDAVRYGRPI